MVFFSIKTITKDNDILFEEVVSFDYTQTILDKYNNDVFDQYYTIYSNEFHDYLYPLINDNLTVDSTSYMNDIFNQEYNLNKLSDDTDNYTYIVSPGHKLLKMEYNLVSDGKIIATKIIVPKMYFSYAKENKVYIYKTNKLFIGYFYYGKGLNVFYIDDNDNIRGEY